MKFKFLSAILFCCSLSIYGQTDDSIKIENTYSNLEEALKNPDNVYRLDLSNQFFNQFPASVAKFKNLRYLSLKNDHLKEIPKEISLLTKLKILDLSGNDFKFLPVEMKKLKNLEEIYLNDEPSADVIQELSILAKLPKLRILHLENDKMGILPKSINNLKHLEKLYLNDNELTDLPPYITNNKKLFYIDMKNNPFQWKGERPFGITINF